MAWAHLLFFALYVGLGIEMLRALFKRRDALSAWRAAVGGDFDKGQRRFVTSLDLDHARLPKDAVRLLQQSRRTLALCSVVLVALLALQLLIMVL
jgi:hypothetical protein